MKEMAERQILRTAEHPCCSPSFAWLDRYFATGDIIFSSSRREKRFEIPWFIDALRAILKVADLMALQILSFFNVELYTFV